MNLNRRTLGLSLVALAATPAKAVIIGGGGCGGGGGWGDEPIWGRGTSVQSLVQQIMAGRITRLQPAIRNATREQHDAHMRAIFPQVIEQNFVRLDVRTLRTYMHTASDNELSQMAALYSANLNGLSRQGRLLPVLAVRCNDADMLRWAAAFGAMPVYEALARYAPQKVPNFQLAINSGGVMMEPPLNQTFQPNLDMTVLRIYQGFRSAPIGASSVPASLYQTASYVGGNLVAAATIGYTIGSGVAWLIQAFAPSLWDDIGGTLYEIMQNLSGLLGIPISQAQENEADDFGVGSLSPVFEQTGGDYGAVAEWSIAAGYGGGGC